jgi:hypothetical protein
MPKHAKIQFSASSHPIAERVTKFGGQPVWVAAPQWPLSRETGNPMRFIGQIALDDAGVPMGAGKMAYLFMTDEAEYVDGTWEPDGGENAVIIQPDGAAPAAATVPTAYGPSLYEMVQAPGAALLTEEEREYAVRLSVKDEPAFVPEAERADWNQEAFGRYAEALDGNKIGGSPIFLQADEFPDDSVWHMLLQLDSSSVPFSVNFGDAGIAYVFVDPTASVGKMLWQCS